MTLLLLRQAGHDAWRHPRVRLAWRMALAGLIVLVVAIMFWWPTRLAVSQLHDEINQARRLVQEKHASVALAEATHRAATLTQLTEKKLNQEGLQATLVRELEMLARRHGVRVMSSNYDENKPQDGFVSLVHELAVQASYGGLRAFLLDLASLPTLTVLEEASVARVSERSSGELKATFQFRTWRRVTDASEKRP